MLHHSLIFLPSCKKESINLYSKGPWLASHHKSNGVRRPHIEQNQIQVASFKCFVVPRSQQH